MPSRSLSVFDLCARPICLTKRIPNRDRLTYCLLFRWQMGTAPVRKCQILSSKGTPLKDRNQGHQIWQSVRNVNPSEWNYHSPTQRFDESQLEHSPIYLSAFPKSQHCIGRKTHFLQHMFSVNKTCSCMFEICGVHLSERGIKIGVAKRFADHNLLFILKYENSSTSDRYRSTKK